VAGFVDVLLRGLALCGQAVAIGGVFFAALLLRPASRENPAARSRLARSLALTAGGAIVVAGAQALSQAVQLSVLGDAAAGWPLGRSRARATSGRASPGSSRAPGWSPDAWPCEASGPSAMVGRARGFTVALGAGSAWMSHAAGRLGPEPFSWSWTRCTQLGAGVWIGGLLHLMVSDAPPSAAR